jgi:histidinol-phosphate aminotransferase
VNPRQHPRTGTRGDPRRFLRSDFDDLEAYVPVKPLDVLAAEIGMPVDRLVKLDANENLYGPIPEVRAAIAASDIHIYPDPGQVELRKAIGRYLNVDPAQVVCGQGADDLIDILMRLMRPERMVTATPTFGMYSFLAKINGVEVVEVPRAEGFAVDLPAMAETIIDRKTMVFLASPNNPTGNTLTEAEIAALCGLDALVVIDEAYAEFSATTAVSLIEHFSNLVILRTFSKWAGLAGLRVGYSVSHPELAARMMDIKQPYNVNVAADVAARTALEHQAEIHETVRCLVAERARMSDLVGELGWLEPIPSESNFVLFQVHGRMASQVAADLRARGVLVRYYDRPDLSGYIRISAGRPEDTDRLIAALTEIVGEGGVS